MAMAWPAQCQAMNLRIEGPRPAKQAKPENHGLWQVAFFDRLSTVKAPKPPSGKP